MKIIHCADLHLDSKLNANLDKEKARLRRGELLNTFVRMVRYATAHEVEAILIAGDLFDKRTISATARNTVLHTISENPHITFYYLSGNHDGDGFLAELSEIPDNIRTFGDGWTSYEECDGAITINAVELTPDNSGSVGLSLVLDSSRFNIVMLHGQESESKSKDKAEIINLSGLRNKGIDYLALGHIHGYKCEQLDPRATYCYPGCLEGRGFDECGEHGFVLLDIDEKAHTYTHTFVPFAQRQLYELRVDVSGLNTTAQMIDMANKQIEAEGCSEDSLIKFVLCGEVDVECEKNVALFEASFDRRFYYVKTYDETGLKIDYDAYRLDESLKGEFVRTVLADDSISESDKMTVIRFGLQAIAGEEVQ